KSPDCDMSISLSPFHSVGGRYSLGESMVAGSDMLADFGGHSVFTRVSRGWGHRMRPVCSAGACLFAMGLLAACAASVPSAKFELLADSTSTVVTDARNTFARVERLQRKFVVAVLPTGDHPLTIDSFKPEVEGRSFDLVPELAFRQAA